METQTIGGIVTLIVLSALVVMNSGVFQRKNQNWTTIICVAVAMPVFAIIMLGLFSLILG